MPLGVPQSLMYNYRGAGADGNVVRDRSQEQAPTYSGNPNMPVFNQPSPSNYQTQTYGGQAGDGSSYYGGDPSSGVGAAQASQGQQTPSTGYNGVDSLGNSLGGSVNGGRIRPNPNTLMAMRRMRGMRGNSGYNTGVPQDIRGQATMPSFNNTGPMGIPINPGQQVAQGNQMMWQGHAVSPEQYANIQATNANTARMRAQPPVLPQPPATY